MTAWHQLWRIDVIEIETDLNAQECIERFSSGIAPTFGSSSSGIATPKIVQELKRDGVLLQGKMGKKQFDVCCIEVWDAGRTDSYRPHFRGRIVSTENGASIEGTVRILWQLKVMIPVLIFMATTLIVTGAATSTYFLSGVGLFFAFAVYFLPVKNLEKSVSHWETIPRNVELLIGRSS